MGKHKQHVEQAELHVRVKSEREHTSHTQNELNCTTVRRAKRSMRVTQRTSSAAHFTENKREHTSHTQNPLN